MNAPARRNILIPLFVAALLMNQTPAPSMDDPDLILRRAYDHSIRGQNEEAVEDFRLFFASGEESGYTRAEYARVLFQLGRMDEAVEQCSLAIALDSTESEYVVLHSEIWKKKGDKKKALSILSGALHRFPDDVNIEFALAESLNDLRKFNDARIHYRQVLFSAESGGARLYAYKSISLWKLAVLHLDDGEFEKARTYLLRYLDLNPDRLYPRFVLGYHIYFQQGLYDRAKEQFSIILSHGEGNARRQDVDLFTVYSALGRIAFLEDDLNALNYLERARRKKNDDILTLALILTIRNEDREALGYLLPFARKMPGNIFIRYALMRILARTDQYETYYSELYNVANLLSDLGRHRQSNGLLKEALALKRGDDDPEKFSPDLSYLFEKIAGNYESLEAYNRAVVYTRLAIDRAVHERRFSDGPGLAVMKLAYSRLIANVGLNQKARALRLCNDVINEYAEMDMAYFVRGLINLQFDMPGPAMKDFSKAIELNKNSFQYYFYRAVAGEALNNFEQTESDLKRVLELKPDLAEAANFLGYMYAEKGVNLDRAEQLVEIAVENSPTNGAYQDSLGWIYYMRGKYEKARYHVRLATLILEEEKREDPIVFDHLGDIYDKLGYPARALAQYRRAIYILEKKQETQIEDKQNASGTWYEEKNRDLEKSLRNKIERITERKNGKKTPD